MAHHRSHDLETLRKELVGQSNLDSMLFQIREASKKIHAAYLFEAGGTAVLQQICLFMSSTPSGTTYATWQDFGAHLGLTREQLQCIEYDFIGLEDPTYYVLLTFAQSVDATIDRILEALQQINRCDIIHRLSAPVTVFLDGLNIATHSNDYSKPRCIPRAPLVLSPVIPLSNSNIGALTNSLGDASNPRKRKKYGSIVMLTFSEDGRTTAYDIAKLFREKNPSIGVVILQEQAKLVYAKAEEFIDDCFKQVDYIIPLLTKGYIERINNSRENVYKPEENSLDSKYLKYVYSLLKFEYVKNNYCNHRVRCLVADVDSPMIMNSDLHPILQAWFRKSDIDDFATNVLLKTI